MRRGLVGSAGAIAPAGNGVGGGAVFSCYFTTRRPTYAAKPLL
jgi:hypothetical protein